MALFGEKTLYELRQSHAEVSPLGLSHSQGFPDCNQVRTALGERFHIKLLESTMEIEWHQSVPHLLRSLKAIGAQNASRNRPGGLVSRHLMQSMYDCYRSRFGRDGTIPASYEVIYLLLQKKQC
jgi:malonyl-CoA O-methyltransferase